MSLEKSAGEAPTLTAINPANGQVLKTYPETPVDEACRILIKMQAAFEDWQQWSFTDRGACFKRLAGLLRDGKGQHARTITLEMGKPISEAEAEIEKCAWACDHYADHAEALLQDEIIPTDMTDSRVTYRPLGIILAVMPWNFPFWQVIRAAAPAMMAGNAMVLKHASQVPDCALTLEALFQRAGFPMDAFRCLLLGSRNTPLILVNDLVRGVTMTGSTRAGETLAAQCGSQLKKAVFELGGSDAYLILADADLDAAAEACARGRMVNGGQSCIAAKRFVVEKAIQATFSEKLVKAMTAWTPDDPLEPDCRLGPMARMDLRDKLHEQVKASIAAGARCLLGGEAPAGDAAFYPPTVLDGVKPGMPAYSEELFGPVAAILPAEDEEDAIRIANDTVYGLGGGIFSRNVERATDIARHRLQSGMVAVNRMVASDPRLPFGGIRKSGIGREQGALGIREFVNAKTLMVD
ncbi:MAG: NAD-dependent succinate-semialdehyde dehydrogenase [Opitutales bacterium]